ncbi:MULTISPECIES: hypothetical protein [Chryseobacterium]|jgi:hypothetical protein|uniref:Uncharacterized protein n=1 Tax=Chryseobacterium nepalense TaxID=1854498 RepID=A0ABY4K3N7_9FLAO|nr:MULTISPECIES: hypothetical protein [Chryseobacterium]MEA1851187.1 hypothetical protein [Chryseobacterium sp. MHB01]MEC5173076.1 hypothetical protein [Chryseobacterium nepalense]UPQ74393.1 hypothetical protein M0D58_10055 [Chryseobacterium nepalense]
MNNQQTIQGVLSIVALLCLVVGWFDLFSPDINILLSRRVFYVLIGISFFLQAPLMTTKNFMYAMYAAAGLCVVGALFPVDWKISGIKTLGLLGGIILSFSNRPNYRQ